jgi:two-component system phosphate regulon sensor histidine kinase PhoR
LLDGALDDKGAALSFAEMIARHADRLAHLTQELLDLSRIESGDWQFRIGPVEIKSVANAVFDLLRSRAEARQMTLASERVDVSALADRRALEQMVLNLVDNAIKHTPERGTITVRAESAEGQVTLSVDDTGPGIESHHLDRLFERFYRVDPGRAREAGGTGLGLAIVKHLAQAQKGDVGVKTGPTGSRFWIRLPAPDPG